MNRHHVILAICLLAKFCLAQTPKQLDAARFAGVKMAAPIVIEPLTMTMFFTVQEPFGVVTTLESSPNLIHWSAVRTFQTNSVTPETFTFTATNRLAFEAFRTKTE